MTAITDDSNSVMLVPSECAVEQGDRTPRSAKNAPLSRWIRHAVAGDMAAALLAMVLTGLVRFGPSSLGRVTVQYTLLAVAVTLLWPILGALCGTYELRTSLFGVEELRRILRAGLALAAGVGMAHFLLKLSLSRGFVGGLIPLVIACTGAWRTFLRSRTSSWMAKGLNHHQAVAMGSVADIAELYERLRGRAQSPINIVAFVADDLETHDPVPAALDDVLRLSNRDAIRHLPDLGIAVDLLVRAGRPEVEEMAILSQRAHSIGVGVAIAPNKAESESNVTFSYVPLGSTPLLLVETPTLRPVAAFVKASLDRTMALAFLVLLAPVFVTIAVTIAVREGRPVLFRQQRVGREGEPFCCLKFRTMGINAEDERAALLGQNEAKGPLFKLKHDPRVTPTGRWLRKHSLDELPQLWNVLRGEMSIVGPRPALPAEVATFDIRTRRRLRVRPGITGLWQVEGRSDLPWSDGVYLDVMYVDHWSPLLDWVIIARTVRTVIRPSGAY